MEVCHLQLNMIREKEQNLKCFHEAGQCFFTSAPAIYSRKVTNYGPAFSLTYRIYSRHGETFKFYCLLLLAWKRAARMFHPLTKLSTLPLQVERLWIELSVYFPKSCTVGQLKMQYTLIFDTFLVLAADWIQFCSASNLGLKENGAENSQRQSILCISAPLDSIWSHPRTQPCQTTFCNGLQKLGI